MSKQEIYGLGEGVTTLHINESVYYFEIKQSILRLLFCNAFWLKSEDGSIFSSPAHKHDLNPTKSWDTVNYNIMQRVVNLINPHFIHNKTYQMFMNISSV